MDAYRLSIVLLSLTSLQALRSKQTVSLILTPLIKQGLIENARNESQVDPKYFLNVTSYSGFLTVNEKYNSNLFFWYFPHQDQTESRPWIIWLQGGPGASSLYGLFDEMGPFSYSHQELRLRDSAWTKEFSVLFIDNPVGTGYSFTDNYAGAADGMATYSEHLNNALQQFVTMFPELRKAPLFIAGESYAGLYVPAFATAITNSNPTGDRAINLEGLILGNPVLEREDISNYSQLFYQWGMIDSQGLQAVKPLQDALINAIQRNDPQSAYNARNELLDKLYYISIQTQNYNILQNEIYLTEYQNYFRQPEILTALHVISDHSQLPFLKEDHVKIEVAKKLIPDFLIHMRPMVENLLEHYRVMIYCGQLDVVAACVPSAEARRNWIWSRRKDFLSASRLPWTYNYNIAGYVKSGGGLTEVLVRSAGHLVPMDKGPEARQMVSLFIHNKSLPYDQKFIPISEYTPELLNARDSNSTGYKSVMIGSMILNAVLLCGVLGGYMYYKRRSNYRYSANSDRVLSNPI